MDNQKEIDILSEEIESHIFRMKMREYSDDFYHTNGRYAEDNKILSEMKARLERLKRG